MSRKVDYRGSEQRQVAGAQTGRSGFLHGVDRRYALMALGGVVAATGLVAIVRPGLAAAEEVVVYKSPSCECCGRWAEHLRQNGFAVSMKETEDMDAIKKQAGVPYELESCHTAFVGGYVVEGHVPAENIRKILAERPDIKGLAVPGMPASSPGMDAPVHEPYTVFSFDSKGALRDFATY